MSYYHGYKQRDFHFAQLLVTLRKRASLTQEEVALRVGVTERAIGNWEGGSNYPTESNLQKLIELYLDKNAFEPGHEQDEARALWNQLHESVPRRVSSFDEQWCGPTRLHFARRAPYFLARSFIQPDDERAGNVHQEGAPGKSLADGAGDETGKPPPGETAQTAADKNPERVPHKSNHAITQFKPERSDLESTA